MQEDKQQKLVNLMGEIDQILKTEIDNIVIRLFSTLPDDTNYKGVQNLPVSHDIETLKGRLNLNTITSRGATDHMLSFDFNENQYKLYKRCAYLASLRHFTDTESHFGKVITVQDFESLKLRLVPLKEKFDSAGGVGLNIFQRIWDKIQAIFTNVPVRLKFFNQISNNIETYNNTVKPQQ